MKGYTIQESINRLEKEVANGSGGSGGASSAADVSYSNTSSGLAATNVQAALDEIDGDVDTLAGTVTTLSGDVTTLLNGHVYSTNEAVVGKWIDDRSVYEKVVSVGSLLNASAKSVDHGISGLDSVIAMTGIAIRPGENLNNIPLVFVYDQLNGNISLSVNATQVNVRTFTDMSSYTQCYVILRYVKTESVTNTRIKKK